MARNRSAAKEIKAKEAAKKAEEAKEVEVNEEVKPVEQPKVEEVKPEEPKVEEVKPEEAKEGEAKPEEAKPAVATRTPISVGNVDKLKAQLAEVVAIGKLQFVNEKTRMNRLNLYVSAIKLAIVSNENELFEIFYDFFKKNKSIAKPEIIFQHISNLSYNERGVIETFCSLMHIATSGESIEKYDLERASRIMKSDALVRFLLAKQD